MATISAITRLANPRKPGRTAARSKSRPTAVRRATRRKATRTGTKLGRNKSGQFISKKRTQARSTAKRRTASAPVRRRTARRPNPAIVYTLGPLLNPHRPASRRTAGGRPKSKGKKVSMAKKRTSRRRTASRTRRAASSTRRRRRNPSVRVVYRTRRRRTRRNPVSAAPVRRRYTKRRRSIGVRRMSRRRRNPSVYGSRIGSVGSLKVVLAGLAGVAAVKIAGRFVPGQLRQFGGLGDAAITGALAIGAGMLATKFFGAQVGEAVTFGGLMMAGSVALNTVAPNFRVMEVPLALSGYGNNGMGMWMPARFPVPQNPITAGYVAPAPPSQVSGLSRAFPKSF